MTSVFIDTGATVNGDGTRQSPYNNLAYISQGGAGALTGDLGGTIIYIKCNTVTREQLKLASASNFTIQAYDSGDRPVVNGSDLVASWTVEAALWYTSSAAVHGVFVDDKEMEDVALKGSLAAGKMWFDSVNSRIYIGTDPTNRTVEVTTRDKCIWLAGCSDFEIKDVWLTKADESNLVIDGGASNAIVNNIKSCFAGGWNNSGRDGILIVGDSGTPDTGVVVKNCCSNNNQNCGLELHYLNGAVVTDNLFHDNGNSVELWQGVTNSEFRRNSCLRPVQRGTSNGHQNGFWSAGDDQSGDGGNPSNTIAYNIIVESGAAGIDINDGTGQLIYNNTMYNCCTGSTGDALHFRQTGTNQVGATVKNNIVVLTGTTEYAVQVGSAVDNTTKSNMVMQDNQYWHTTNVAFPKFQIDATAYSNADAAIALAAFMAALPTPDTTSEYGDPVFVDATDFELDTGSPCIDTGEDVGEATDFRNYPLRGNVDRGAMEKRTHGLGFNHINNSNASEFIKGWWGK